MFDGNMPISVGFLQYRKGIIKIVNTYCYLNKKKKRKNIFKLER